MILYRLNAYQSESLVLPRPSLFSVEV